MATTAEELVTQYRQLSDTEKAVAHAQVLGIGPPPPAYVGIIWIMVVGAFIVLLLVGAWLLYDLVQDDKATEVIAPLVTAAVGVLAGLLAPSPIAK